MVKSWSRFCFLVLAISCLSRGHEGSAETAHETNNETEVNTALLPEAEAAGPTPSPLPPHSQSQNSTDLPPETSKVTKITADPQTTDYDLNGEHTVPTTEEVNGSTAAQALTSVNVPGGGGEEGDTDVTTISTSPPAETTTTSGNNVHSSAGKDEGSETGSKGSSSWGYVILVLIILVIIALSVILYLLRRVSRTYSFDLQRPAPVNHHNEPIGTFEPVYLDDLDRPVPKDQVTTDDLSPPPVTNGTTLQSEEKGSNGENAPQEQPGANGTETSLTSNTSPSLGDDPADKTSSPLGSTNLLFDAVEEGQQNENNNNPSVCSSDPFVEINLDDQAWCDQLLGSTEAPSSVLPFSPFSFSSSSSSS